MSYFSIEFIPDYWVKVCGIQVSISAKRFRMSDTAKKEKFEGNVNSNN